jgi:CheY-like chemotaxis protein
MNKSPSYIMLVDDNEVDNLIHGMTIKETLSSTEVIDVSSGQAGIDYLRSIETQDNPNPEVIFLAINMPGMDGWEFLDEYKTLSDDIKSHIIIIMLTTSLNPDDQERANNISEINGFLNKPLDAETLQEIINTHFNP